MNFSLKALSLKEFLPSNLQHSSNYTGACDHLKFCPFRILSIQDRVHFRFCPFGIFNPLEILFFGIVYGIPSGQLPEAYNFIILPSLNVKKHLVKI